MRARLLLVKPGALRGPPTVRGRSLCDTLPSRSGLLRIESVSAFTMERESLAGYRRPASAPKWNTNFGC